MKKPEPLRTSALPTRFWGDYPKALWFQEQSLKINIELGSRKGESNALGNLGDVYAALGDYSEALSFYERCRKIKNEIGDRHGEGKNFGSIGNAYLHLGDYVKAVLFLEQSLKISKETGDRHDEGSCLGDIGNVFASLGDYPKALSFYEQSLKIKKELGNRIGEGNVLNNLGTVYLEISDYPKALLFLEEALALFKKAGIPTEETEANIADVYLEQGALEKAKAVFTELNQPTRTGRCYLRVEDYQKAREEFVKALARNEGAPPLLTAAYIGLGLSLEGLGDYSKAREYYLKGVELIERQREALTELQRRNFFSGKEFGFSRIEPYEGLVRVSTELKDVDNAVYWAETTKARLLLEAMAGRSSEKKLGLPQDIAKTEAEFTARIAATYKQMDIALEKNPERYKELEKELAALKKDRDSFISRLRKEYPEYASIRYPEPIKLRDFGLDAQETLIEYEVTDKVTFAWLIRGKKVIKALTIPISRKELAELVKKYRGFFEGVTGYKDLARFDPKVGRALYDLLVKDFAPELKADEPIIIIPDEILGILSFEALVVSLPADTETKTGKFGPYPVGVTYFGDQHPISTYQSAGDRTFPCPHFRITVI